jgi:hypothetical protein
MSRVLKILMVAAALAVVTVPVKAQELNANALEAVFTVVYYDWLCSPPVPLSSEARNALAFITSFASREANDAAESKIKKTYDTLGRGKFCTAMAEKAEADIADLNGRR